ncbi:hypothetical protein D3C81_2248620 [compost metagenome]
MPLIFRKITLLPMAYQARLCVSSNLSGENLRELIGAHGHSQGQHGSELTKTEMTLLQFG